MTMSSHLWFPSTGVQVLSALIHFTGVTVLAHCLSRRVVAEQLTSLQGIMQISFARMLILLVFFDSWLFMFTSGILIFGVGLETSKEICEFGMILCIIFYATSKVLVYAFLVEKVHIVWGPITGTRRFRSPVYSFCFMTMLGYIAVIVLLFVGRIGYFRDGGACVIGLKHFASIPVLAYDLWINILLTGLFLWPLLRAPVSNSAIRRVAVRTLGASFVALTTSAVNMLVLTLMNGKQLGWVCLGACGADVVVNAIALFWVTSGSHQTASSVNGRGSSHARISQGGGIRAPNFKQSPVVLHSLPASPSATRALSPARVEYYTAEDDAKEAPFGSTVSLGGGGIDYAQVASHSPGSGQRVAFSATPTTGGSQLSPAVPEAMEDMMHDSGWRVGRSTSRRGRGRMQRLVGLFHQPRDEREEHSLQVTVTREYVVDQETADGHVQEAESDHTIRGSEHEHTKSQGIV